MDPFNPHTAGAWRYPPRKKPSLKAKIEDFLALIMPAIWTVWIVVMVIIAIIGSNL